MLVFGEETEDLLLRAINLEIPSKFGLKAKLLTREDIRRSIGFFLHCIAKKVKKTMKKRIRSSHCESFTMTHRKFVSCLQFDVVLLCDSVNRSFIVHIRAGGSASGDESMFRWLADSPANTLLPRKTTKNGVKVHNLVVQLTASATPYSIYMLPDIVSDTLGPNGVVGAMLERMRTAGLHSLTTDSWYCTPGLLSAANDPCITTSCGNDDLAQLAEVAAHNLRRGKYRVFQNGSLIYSVFADNGIFRVLTNAFEADLSSVAPVIRRDGTASRALPTTAELLHQEPILSQDDIDALEQLSHAGLKSLAARMGVAQGLAIVWRADLALF